MNKTEKVALQVKRDWARYNRKLVDRGRIMELIIREDVLAEWEVPVASRPGRPTGYSDVAIRTIQELKYYWKMGLRQAQGFFESIFKNMGIDKETPNYTLLSKRGKGLKIRKEGGVKKGNVSIAIDSTGLKEIGPGAYDWRSLYKRCNDLAIKLIVPPREGSVVSVPENESGMLTRRDIYIADIEYMGLKEWKRYIGYHKRSLVENAFHRYKSCFGGSMSSKLPGNQCTEVAIKIDLLNRINCR